MKEPLDGMMAHDRPDIVAHFFYLNLERKDEIQKKGIIGSPVFNIYVMHFLRGTCLTPILVC